jgi:hypothetical protein
MVKSFSYTSIQFSKIKYILWSSCTVFLGGLIYLLLRPAEPVFFDWFRTAGIDNWVYIARERTLSIGSFLPQWMVYSLPNGLWAFAYTMIVLSIWSGSSSRLKYFWFLTIPVLIFGFEILQFTGDFPGTFCFQDITSGILGIIVGFIIVKIKPK